MKTPPTGTKFGRLTFTGALRRVNNRTYKTTEYECEIEQANNTSRNVWIEWNGVKRTLAQWSRELGFNYGKVQYRLSRGWPFHVAILNA